MKIRDMRTNKRVGDHWLGADGRTYNLVALADVDIKPPDDFTPVIVIPFDIMVYKVMPHLNRTFPHLHSALMNLMPVEDDDKTALEEI